MDHEPDPWTHARAREVAKEPQAAPDTDMLRAALTRLNPANNKGDRTYRDALEAELARRGEPEPERKGVHKSGMKGRATTAPDDAKVEPLEPPRPEPKRAPRSGEASGWKLQTGELEQLPDQTWLVPGVFQRGAVTIVYGPSTVGKSQIAMCIAYSTAHGLQWDDERFSPGLAMYLACEDIESMKVRSRAWRIQHDQLVDPDVDNMTWFNGERAPMFNLLDPNRLAALDREIANEQRLKGGFLRVLVIDHRRKAMIPLRGQEHVRGPYAAIQVIQALRSLAQKYDCAIILIAHTEKGGKNIAGPQEWADYAQTVYRVSATNDNMLMENEKQRAAPLKHVQFTRHNVVVGKTDRGAPAVQPCVRFAAFVAAKDAPGDNNLFLDIATRMQPGQMMSLPQVERLIGLSVGGNQHDRLRKAVPLNDWKKQTVREPYTAIKRDYDGGKELIYCLATEELEPPVAPASDEGDPESSDE